MVFSRTRCIFFKIALFIGLAASCGWGVPVFAQQANLVRIQLNDMHCTSGAGTVVGTPSGDDNWSEWASDSDLYDPDCVRLKIDDHIAQELDIRICINVRDQAVIGTTVCTPWASEGGGWSDWSYEPDKWAYDDIRIKVDSREMPGQYINDIQLEFQNTRASGDNCDVGVGAVAHTPYMSDGGGWSGWAPDGVNEGSIACSKIRLQVDVNDIAKPVTTVSYALNGSGTYSNASSVTLDHNDTIAIRWSATNNPTSCWKVDGPSNFNVDSTSGTDTSVAEPSAGETTKFTVRCENGGGGDGDTLNVSRAPVPTVTLYGTKTGTAETTGNMTLGEGETITKMRWASTEATSCSKESGPSNFDVSGVNSSDSSVSDPAAGGSTTYTVSCTGPGGTAQDSIVVSKTAPPVTTISYALNGGSTYTTGSSVTLDYNDTIAIRWSGTNSPTSCSRISGPSDFAVSGASGTDTAVTEPGAGGSTTFTVRCSNYGGHDDASITVSRTAAATVTLYGTKTGTAETTGNMTLGSGQTITNIRWASTGVTSCSKVAGPSDFVVSGASGSDASVTEPGAGGSTTFTVSCSGVGGTAQDSIVVSKTAPPVTTISYALNGGSTYTAASSVTLDANDTIAINWSGTNSPTSCSKVAGPSDFVVGAVTGPDTSVTEPASGGSTTFTVRCSNYGGSDDASITVSRAPVPTVTVYGTRTGASETSSNFELNYAQNITSIRWASTGATSCSKVTGPSNFVVSGTGSSDTSVTSPAGGDSTTFTVSCTGPGGTAQDSIEVSRASAPLVNLYVTATGQSETLNNVTIDPGDQITLRWASSNATSCNATAGTGFSASASSGTDSDVSEPGSGSDRTFTIACSGDGGIATDSITVTTEAVPPVFSVSPDSGVRQGDTVTFSWSLGGNDAATCSFSGPGVPATFSGDSGTFQLAIQGSSEFRFSCLGGYVDVDVEVLPEVFEN